MTTSELWKSKETDDSGIEFMVQTYICLNSGFMSRFWISWSFERFTPYLVEITYESVRYMHVCMHALI